VSTSSKAAAVIACANAMYACLAAWLKFSSAFAGNCLKAFDGNFPSLRFHIPNCVC
jgi:hypothetical protein